MAHRLQSLQLSYHALHLYKFIRRKAPASYYNIIDKSMKIVHRNYFTSIYDHEPKIEFNNQNICDQNINHTDNDDDNNNDENDQKFNFYKNINNSSPSSSSSDLSNNDLNRYITPNFDKKSK